MKRVLSQRLMCSESDILLYSVVEIDTAGVVTRLISVDEHRAETSQTLFYSGIITPAIVSLTQRAFDADKFYVPENLSIISVDNNRKIKIPENINGNIVVDLNTESASEATEIVRANMEFFGKMSVFEIINALVFHPAQLLAIDNRIKPGAKVALMLWPNPEILTEINQNNFNIRQV